MVLQRLEGESCGFWSVGFGESEPAGYKEGKSVLIAHRGKSAKSEVDSMGVAWGSRTEER